MNCDLIAPCYALMERAAFGNLLIQTRRHFLPEIARAQRVLALGDGDGRALVALLKACPQAQVDYVDLSARMLNLAKDRVQNAGFTERVHFIHGDALSSSLPEHAYDAVVTHFFLDCLDEARLRLLADKVRAAAKPEAFWVISEFQTSQVWARAVVRILYFLFRCSTGLRVNRLVRYREILAGKGFHETARSLRAAGLLVSELWVANQFAAHGGV